MNRILDRKRCDAFESAKLIYRHKNWCNCKSDGHIMIIGQKL